MKEFINERLGIASTSLTIDGSCPDCSYHLFICLFQVYVKSLGYVSW